MSMIRGLLSPSNITNCQYFLANSPSNKKLNSSNLCDSGYSTVHSSSVKDSCIQGSKFYSFKKIKEDRIKQKNQQGRVIKQMIYTNGKKKNQRLNTLDQVKTIESRYSPRSSFSVGKKMIEQSIIIMRGRDLGEQLKDENNEFMDPKEPGTPFFKRRNTLNEDCKQKNDYLKPISINPALVKSIQSGLILHYEITNHEKRAYERFMPIHHEGVLEIYSVIPIKSEDKNYSLVLYEPYSQTLTEHLLRSENISYSQIVVYMIDLIKIISFLRQFCIYPEIEPATVLLSHGSIKLKLRAEQSSQRQVLRQSGRYLSFLLKSLLNGYSPTPSSMTRKIIGLTINKRLELENLLDDFVRVQDYSLDLAYLKLQAISC